MKIQRHLLFQLFFLFLALSTLWGEEGRTVRGKVLEKGTRRPLEGVTVFLSRNDSISTISAPEGTFEIPLKESGELYLVAIGAGFLRSKPVKIPPPGEGGTEGVVLYLEPIYSLTEVVVQGERAPDRIAKTVIGGQELASVPGSAGDPLRAIQALPGITTSDDSGAAPAIRGSGPQDNAYYVDFLQAGYLFHMGGMESVINADLVEDFNLYTSSFGPEYTDVTGGVIDVRLRDPRKDRIGGKVNLSLLEADALIEGPVTEKQRFYLAARRSYLDLIASKSGSLDKDQGIDYRQYPQFYDYQGKYLWEISPASTLTFQATGAADRMKLVFRADSDLVKHDPILSGDYEMQVSYNSQGLVLASRIAPGLTNKLGVSHLRTSTQQQLTQLGHADVDEDNFILRDHLTVLAGERHELLFGVESGAAQVRLDLDTATAMPSDFNPDLDYTSSQRFTNFDHITMGWTDLAVKDRWKVADTLTLVLGAHGSYESYFDKYRAEPRLGIEYNPTGDTLFTAGWGKYHQFPEGFQVVNGIGNPHLSYVKADHYTIGVEQQFGGWSAKIEGYYKKLDDLVVPVPQPENFLNLGSGHAYGSELLIKKNRTSDWSGWLSAAYSKTERKNDRTGAEFPFGFDQPFIVNLVYEWHFLPKWSAGAKWRFQSGAPFTPVVGTRLDAGRIRPNYGPLGSERLPDYHRLDLRIAREYLFDTWKMSTYLDIINAYARENVSGYIYNADFTSRKPAKELPFLPAVGVKAEF